jgi:hypothetical protein
MALVKQLQDEIQKVTNFIAYIDQQQLNIFDEENDFAIKFQNDYGKARDKSNDVTKENYIKEYIFNLKKKEFLLQELTKEINDLLPIIETIQSRIKKYPTDPYINITKRILAHSVQDLHNFKDSFIRANSAEVDTFAQLNLTEAHLKEREGGNKMKKTKTKKKRVQIRKSLRRRRRTTRYRKVSPQQNKYYKK